MSPEPFPTVDWQAWECEATFFPGAQLPEESRDSLYASLIFVFYGDKVALADIEGRGWCIPSGRIEPGETIDAAAVREAWEETGAHLHPTHRSLVGCYRMISQSGLVRWCPVFVAEALGFAPIPDGSESRGLLLAAVEDVADLYFIWDPLMAAVFSYAEERKLALFPAGTPMTEFTRA